MNKPLFHGRASMLGGGSSAKANTVATPVQGKDNLRSKSTARLIDIISEGPILGLVNGLQSVIVNDIPVQEANGLFNYSNARLQFRTGEKVQAPLDGFSDVENQFQVNLTPKSKSNTVGRVGIISGGSGYTNATVTFVGQLGTPGVVGGTGPNANLPLVETKPAQGHVVITNGAITQIVIDDPGSNYVGHPEVRVTGDGTGFSGYPVMGGGSIYSVKDNNVDAVRITGLLRNFYAGDDKGNVGDISVIFRLEYRDDINQDWRPAFDDSKFISFAGGVSPLTNAFRGDAQFLVKAGESYNIEFVARNTSTNGATFVYDRVSGYNDTGADMMVNATGLALDLPLGQYDHSVGDTYGHTLLGYTPYYYDYNNANITITGKTTSGYEEAWLVRLPVNRGKRDVRMWRVIEDSTNQYWFNDITFEYATEVISSRIMYADSALCAFEADAEFFGGSVPKRAYDVYGRIIRVPSNYDPAARSYNGLWDGTFKYAYSNNPVWVFFDLLTHPRYGLGQWVKDRHIDTGALYVMSRYCDELVDNKRGGRSPRFTLNTQIMNQEEAYSVLNMLASVFRGMIYWSTGTIFATQDSPGPVKRIVSPSKVINGDFSYVGVGKDAQHSVARVAWNDPGNNYERAFAYYEDPSRIDRYGYEVIDLVAYGCTDEAMALRMGKWLIDSEKYANKVVTFRGGWDFADAVPGEIIGVADPTRAGVRQGGRVASATAANLTFDKPYTFEAGQTYVLTVAVPTWGRCLLNPGSATVAGNRTLFNNAYNGLAAGDEIIFDKDPKRYSIKSVDSATQITLTTPYVGSKTGKAHYTVLRNSTFVMSSYVDLLDVPINHPGTGAFSTVTFTRAMPVIVNTESEWIIAASNVVPAQFRIQAVKEVSRGQFEVVALEHDPNKYLRVEQDVPILPPTTYLPPDVKAVTPRNPSAAESRYLRYGVVRNKISLFWEDGSPLNPSSGYYVFADTPNNGTVNYGFTNTQNIDIEDTVAGEYVFYITALSVGGDTSQPLVFSFQASAWDGVVGATVTNLAVVNGYGPDGTYFQTNSPTWAWDITFPAGTPTYDVKFNLYLYDADAGTVIRFIPNVTDQKYTYLYDANYADNGGRPKRKLRLKVVALDVLGREGSSATKVAYNPPPDVPTFDLAGVSNFISVFISAPTDPDFKGYYVWVSKTQAFDPYSTPVTYTGPNNTLYFPAEQDATYYVRVAAFDAFSSNINDLLISPEKSVRASLELVSFAAPSIPQNLVLTTSSYVGDDGETYARLIATWDAVNSDNIGFYDVFIAEGATSNTAQFVGGNYVNTNSYTVNGLPAGLTVSVFVKSISKNRLGVSDPSVIKNIKLALNLTPPGPVTGLKVDNSLQTAAISWANPSNKDLAGVTILRNTSNNYGTATVVGRAPYPATTYIDSALVTGTTYYYWAVTINKSGISGTAAGPVTAVPPQVQAAMLAAGIIDATKVASSIAVTSNVTTLPTTKTTPFVALSTDGKLYRWDTATSKYIASIASVDVTGTLTDAQLAAISAAKVTGQLTDSQLAGLSAAKIAGQLSDTQLAAISAAKITGTIVTAQIAAAAIDTTKLASNIAPPILVTTLPTTKTSQFVTLQSDGKLYRWDTTANSGNGAYVASVAAGDISGTITAAQIAAVNASAVTGQLTDSQLAAVSASKITGTVSDNQIAALSAAKVSGQLTDTQIASGIAASKISGALTSATVDAGKVTGQLTNAQIAAVDAVKVTGQITSTQITDGSISTIKIAASAVVAGSIAAGAVTASKLTLIDTTNIVLNPDFLNGSPENWSINGVLLPSTDTSVPVGAPGAYVARIVAGTAAKDAYYAPFFPVVPGDSYFVEVWVAADAGTTGQVAVGLNINDVGQTVGTWVNLTATPGTPSNPVNSALLTAWTLMRGIVTIPALAAAGKPAAKARFWVSQRPSTTPAGNLYFCGAKIRKAASAELIVDGTITATKIAAGAVTASKLTLVDTSNLLLNGDFAQGIAEDWWVPNSGVVLSNAVSGDLPDNAPALQAAKLTRTTTDVSINSGSAASYVYGVPTAPGVQFYYEAWVYSSVAGNVTTQLVTRTPAGAGSTYSTTVNAVPAGVWTKITGTLLTPTTITDARKTTFRFINSINTATVWVTSIRFLRMNGAELIVDGSITARKLLIGGTTASNLLDVGEFYDGLGGWVLTGQDAAATRITVIDDGTGPTGSPYMRLNRGVTDNSVTLNGIGSDYIPIEPSTQYELLMWNRGDAASNTGSYLRVLWYTGTKAATSPTAQSDAYSNGAITTTWTRRGSTVTSPANAAFARIQVWHFTSSTTMIQDVASITFKRSVGSTLIQDGAITTAKITAGAVTAGTIAAGSILASKLAIASQNVIYNADLRNGVGHITPARSSNTWTTDPLVVTSSFSPDGFNAVRISSLSTTPTSGTYVDATWGSLDPKGTLTNTYPVTAGATYELSVYISANNCSAYAYVRWLDSTGATIATRQAGTIANAGAGPVSGPASSFPRSSVIVVAPAGAVSASVTCRVISAGTAAPAGYFSGLMFAPAIVGQTEASPYVSPGVTTIDGGNVLTNTLSATSIVAGSITSNQIAASTITAGNIAAGTITTSQIQAGTILGGNIAANTITGGNLAANTITALQIAATTITGDRLVSGTITSTQIAASTITGDRIAGATITGGNVVANTLTGGNIAGGTITGGNIAANTITGGNIAASTITAGNISAGTITTREISTRAITSDLIAVNTIQGGNIAARTISAGNLIAYSITANEIAARTIGATNIVAGTLTGNEIAANSVNADRLVANSITAAKIASGAISTDQLAAGAITADKIGIGLSTGNLQWGSDGLAPQVAISGYNNFSPSGYYNGPNASGSSWQPPQMGSIQTSCQGTPGSASAPLVMDTNINTPNAAGGYDAWTPCQPGKRYEFSAYISAHRCDAYVVIGFIGANDANYVEFVGNSTPYDSPTNGPLTSWNRSFGFVTAPANAERMRMWVRGRLTGGKDPYTFSTGWYLGFAQPNQTQPSPWAPQSNTVIAGGQIATASLTADKIVAGSITGDKIAGGTIVGGNIAAGTISVGNLVAGTLSADNISIGNGSVASVFNNTNTTKINGGAIQANSISVASLKVAQRQIQLVGISFYSERDGNGNLTNIVRWTSGNILTTDAAGSNISPYIATSGAQIDNSGYWYIWWNITQPTILQCAKDNWPAIYSDTNTILLATVSGITGISVLVGGTIIDGTRIMTRSIQADVIAANAIQAIHISAGVITGDKIAAGSITADKITSGTLTVGSLIGVGPGSQTEIWSNTDGGGLRVRNRPLSAWRLAAGYLGPWTGDGNDYGLLVWGNDGNIKLRISNAQNYIDTAMIGDATITNAKIGNLEVDTLKVKDGAISNIVAGSWGGDSGILGITCRSANSRIVVMGLFRNDPNVGRSNRSPGSMMINWDPQGDSGRRQTIEAVPKNMYYVPNVNYYWGTTMTMALHSPGAGYHTYSITTNGPYNDSCALFIIEIAK